MRHHAAVVVLKTWANSWMTSHRYHDERLMHCCFGCPLGTDSLDHYLACEPLWYITSAATAAPCVEYVLMTLCIRAPSKGNLLNLTVASGIYHTMEQQYLDRVCAAATSCEWKGILDLAEKIALNSARMRSTINSILVQCDPNQVPSGVEEPLVEDLTESGGYNGPVLCTASTWRATG